MFACLRWIAVLCPGSCSSSPPFFPLPLLQKAPLYTIGEEEDRKVKEKEVRGWVRGQTGQTRVDEAIQENGGSWKGCISE